MGEFHQGQGSSAAEGMAEISLAALLNILWRRRLIVLGLPLLGMIGGIIYGSVVTPLYQAQAIIRPGITQFGTRGGGFRSWKLKDLSRWYGQKLYSEGVAKAMGIELWEVPRIQADFVMKGLQTTEGGNVLTLSILDPDPERGRQFLDSSIDAFSNYVLSDSTSNSLVLSRRGLMIQIEDKLREKQTVEEDAARLRLDYAAAERDSLQVDVLERMAAKELEKLATKRVRMVADEKTYELRARRLEQQSSEISEAVADARKQLDEGADASSLVPGMKPSAHLSRTESYRSLMLAAVELQNRLLRVTTMRDSVAQRLAEHDLEVERARIDQVSQFGEQRAEAGRVLAGLRLNLHSGIDLQYEQIELQIAERRAQMDALSPIERIGPITSSPRPVRPRKQRAINILTFVGLLAGLGAAFAWEYVAHHRAEIFASKAAGSPPV